MRYTPRGTENRDPDGFLYDSLEPVIRGMVMSLIELSLFRSKGRSSKTGRNSKLPIGKKSDVNPGRNSRSVSIKIIVYKEGITGIEDCSRVHRGVLPRLELAFPGQDIYLEVSSPGIDRSIKDGSEFVHYIGRGVKCYRTDTFSWTEGILNAVNENEIILQGESGEIVLPYTIIAKARLADSAAPLGAVIKKSLGG